MTDQEGRDPNDGFYSNILKLVFGHYSQNKEVIRQMIDQEFNSIINPLVIAYKMLVHDKVIDPTDSEDRKVIAHYTLNII